MTVNRPCSSTTSTTPNNASTLKRRRDCIIDKHKVMEISHNTDSRISETNLLDSNSNIKQDIVSIYQYLNSFHKKKYGDIHDQL